MKTPLVVGAAIWSCAAIAGDQKGNADECFSILDDAKRVACYDQALKRPKPEEAGATVGTTVPPIPAISFRVLQKGDYDNFAKADVTAKPATFDIQHKDGQDSSRIKLGLIAVGAAFNDAGWQAFGSLALDRDATGDIKKRKDLRDIGLGVTGTLLQSNDLEWSLFTTVRYRHRQDLYGSLDGDAVGFNANIVKLGWVSGKPVIFVPYAGLLLDRRNGGGTTNRQWNSAYMGATIKIPLGNWITGLSVSGTFEHFQDYSVSNEQIKRSASSGSPEISYEFTDPEDKATKWRPSVSLSRQIGEDVRAGGSRENKTMFSFGLKYN